MPPGRPCSKPALRSLATGGPMPRRPARIAEGDRGHLGRGQISVRRHRRIVGLRGAPPHRRAPCRPSGAGRPHRPTAYWVAAIIDTLYEGLHRTRFAGDRALRSALPRDMAELDRLYPNTAAELASWGSGWIEVCQKAFADIDVDPERISEVAAFIPGAMRGITSGASARRLLRPGQGAPRPDQRDRQLSARIAAVSVSGSPPPPQRLAIISSEASRSTQLRRGRYRPVHRCTGLRRRRRVVPPGWRWPVQRKVSGRQRWARTDSDDVAGVEDSGRRQRRQPGR